MALRVVRLFCLPGMTNSQLGWLGVYSICLSSISQSRCISYHIRSPWLGNGDRWSLGIFLATMHRLLALIQLLHTSHHTLNFSTLQTFKCEICEQSKSKPLLAIRKCLKCITPNSLFLQSCVYSYAHTADKWWIEVHHTMTTWKMGISTSFKIS